MPKLVKRPGTRKFRTGHCANGWCEGTKPKDSQGRPVPTCKDFTRCPCECHAIIDKIFETAGLERILQDISGYVRPERDYWMPGDDQDPLSIPSKPPAPDSDEVMPATTLPRKTAPSSPRTPTCKRRKGTLENEVLSICTECAADKYDWEACTTKLVSEEIRKMTEAEPPSTGAVQAVWERWVKLGFASFEKKPVRFTGFLVDDYSQAALDKLKFTTRQTKKRAKAAQRRGIR